MAEEFKVSLGVELNQSSFDNIRNQLNTLQNNTYRVRLELDTTRVQRQINSIRNQIQNLGRIRINLNGGSGGGNGGQNIQRNVNDITRAYNELMSLQRRMNSIDLRISSLNFSNNLNEIVELEGQLRVLMDRYRELRSTFNDNDFSGLQLDNLNRSIETTTDKISQLRTRMADEITVKLNTGVFNNDIASLETGLSKLRVQTTEVTTGMSEVRNASNDMTTALRGGDIDGLITSYERYKIALRDVQNQISINAKAEKEIANTQKLRSDASNLSLNMDIWLRDNSAAASQFGERIRQLQAELQSCDTTRLSGIKSEFQQITKQAELAGKATQTLGDRFRTQFSKLTTYFSASMVIMQTVRALKDMYNNVVKIDTATTELKKVTNETDSVYSNFLSNSAKEAKEIGTTIDNYVSSTADFARLGHTFNDSQVLAKTANVYAVVGDEIGSIDTATQSIISTMTAFDVKVENSMSIADKFNEVGNKFAISSGGIGEALTRSASSMAAANNSLDETIALITAANTVVQDPDSVGKRLADNKSGYIG